MLKLSDAFTRPADTTAYAAGDLVANSTTAAEVVALKFRLNALKAGAFIAKRARLRKSGATITAAAFRLHLFSAAPTFGTSGDNGAISANTTGIASWLGSIDVIAMAALADGAIGEGAPTSEINAEITAPSVRGDDSAVIYGILEAGQAYTPASAEVFTVTLLGELV